MPKEAFDLFCITCNILVEAKVIARGFGEFRPNQPGPPDDVDAEYHGDHYVVALCRRCSQPFLVREALYGIAGEFETVTHETVLFPISTTAKLEGVPESVARAVDQAHRTFSTASYDACALMCRRSLEALCKTLSATGSNLAQKIADLEANGHIDARLLKWAHGVRLVGNEAAHDVDAAVAQQDAQDILDLTEALLMNVFTLDTKFREFEARRKQDVR